MLEDIIYPTSEVLYGRFAEIKAASAGARLVGLSNRKRGEAVAQYVFRRGTLPSVSTLEALCGAFGITVAQFFAQDEMVEVSPEVRELLKEWKVLTDTQKAAVLQVMRSYRA